MTKFSEYAEKYNFIKMRREDGILEVTLHLDGGSLCWNLDAHTELPKAWYDIASDPENRVVILTGTGDQFIGDLDRNDPRYQADYDPQSELLALPSRYYRIFWEGKRLLQNLLEIDVPMIAAINGPVRIHAELPLLCDIVLASDDALFQDAGHFLRGAAPGDGAHVIWSWVLGPVRARYFLLTGQELFAQEALRLGVVNEVLPADQLLDRAWELARTLAVQSPMALRYSKTVLTQDLKQRLLGDLSHGLLAEVVSVFCRALPETPLKPEEW